MDKIEDEFSSNSRAGIKLRGGGQDDRDKEQEQDISDKIGGSDDSIEAIGIFPEEIWMMIFGNLTDWKDLWNCSKTCLFFHRKLHSLKATFLFDDVFPHLFEHLPGHDILKCRSICKEWNSGVDSYLENHPSIRPQNESVRNSLQCPSFLNPMTEKEFGEVYQFKPQIPGYLKTPNCLEGAMATSRNPFLSRTFLIELPVGYFWSDENKHEPELDDEELDRLDEEYWSALYVFLESYGKYIYYLTLTVCGELGNNDYTDQKMNALLTLDLFRLVPNLRSIFFAGGFQNFAMSGVGSLPPAPKLETMQCTELLFTDDTPHPLIFAFLNAFRGQLKMLQLHCASWDNEVMPFEMPKLTELYIGYITWKTDLEKLSRAKVPQLRKLAVWSSRWKCRRWSNPSEGNEVTLDGFLDSVAKLSATTCLDTLQINGDIEEPEIWLEQTNCPQPLPMPAALKTLELEYSPDSCHSFLLRFPYLENLKLFWVELEPTRRFGREPIKEVVEVNRYVMGGEVGRRRGIYKSNIWKVMPRLKLFSYQREAYTRAEYEGYIQGHHRQQNIGG